MRRCKHLVLLFLMMVTLSAQAGESSRRAAPRSSRPRGVSEYVTPSPDFLNPDYDADQNAPDGYAEAPAPNYGRRREIARVYTMPERRERVRRVNYEDQEPATADEPIGSFNEGCVSCDEGCQSCDDGCGRQSGCSCCSGCNNNWSLQADALWLQPTVGSATQGQIIAPDGSVSDRLSVSNPQYQGGVRIQLSRPFDGRSRIEVLFSGLQQFSGAGTITPDPNGVGSLANSIFLQTPGITGNISGPISYQYGANFYNLELNQRMCLTRRRLNTSLLWGVRYLQWNDRLTLTGSEPLFGAVESVDKRAYNYTIGPQIGLAAGRQWSRLKVNADFKSGLLFNFYEQTYSNLNSTGTQGGFPAISPIARSKHRSGVAGVVDVFANASYQVTSNLAVRGGYQVLFIPGLAQSSESDDVNSYIFMHGPTVGVELIR